MRQTLRIVVILSLFLVFQSACAVLPMGQETDSTSPVAKTLAKSTQSWDGAALPDYPQGKPEITILRILIPAGARLERHYHPVINAGVLTSGQLTVITTEGKTLRLKAGEALVEVVNTMHYGINEGNAPAEIIVFYAGTADSPITVIEKQ